MANAPKLTNEVGAFVVQSLAMFDGPNIAAEAVKREFRPEIPRQLIEGHDLTNGAARELG